MRRGGECQRLGTRQKGLIAGVQRTLQTVIGQTVNGQTVHRQDCITASTSINVRPAASRLFKRSRSRCFDWLQNFTTGTARSASLVISKKAALAKPKGPATEFDGKLSTLTFRSRAAPLSVAAGHLHFAFDHLQRLLQLGEILVGLEVRIGFRRTRRACRAPG